jgi:hypothetical protein
MNLETENVKTNSDLFAYVLLWSSTKNLRNPYHKLSKKWALKKKRLGSYKSNTIKARTYKHETIKKTNNGNTLHVGFELQLQSQKKSWNPYHKL